MQGSKVLAIKVRLNSRNNIQFVDSSGILSASLEKLGAAFSTTSKKLVGAIDFSSERVEKTNEKHRLYLEQDCRTLFEVLSKYFQDATINESGQKITAASQAMDIWRRKLKAPIKVTSQEIQDFCRKGYYGGRTEMFRIEGDGLNSYDANSLYPFSLLNTMPCEWIGTTLDYSRFGFFDVTVQSPELFVPILPIKIEKKLIFPNGIFRGVFFSEELKCALVHGYKIVDVHAGHEFTKASDLFTEYVDHFYKIRLEYPSGTPQNYIAKLAMNSLYGKFGQREEKETLKVIDGSESDYTIFHSEELFEKTGLITIKKSHRSPYMLSHIAAACTSYARIHMNKFYQAYQDGLYYTDTDSIKGKLVLPTGKALGDLKLEKSGFYGYYRGAKLYYERDSKGIEEKKAKGFPHKQFVDKLTLDHYKHTDFIFVEKKFAKLKTSLIRNKQFLSMIDNKKATKQGYNKRRILPCGSTEPWVLKDGKILNEK